MKRCIVKLFGLAIIAFGLSSCKKCLECTRLVYTNYKYTICKEDHFTNDAWNSVVDYYEDNGWDCDPF